MRGHLIYTESWCGSQSEHLAVGGSDVASKNKGRKEGLDGEEEIGR